MAERDYINLNETTETETSEKENPPRDGDRETGAEKDHQAEGHEAENTASGRGKQANSAERPGDWQPRKSRGRKSRDGYPCGEFKPTNGKEEGRYFYSLPPEKPGGKPIPYLRKMRFGYIDDDGERRKSFPLSHYRQTTSIPNTNDERNWHKGTPDGPKILYNLPQITKAAPDATLYLGEGEKDAETLTDMGLLGTCNWDGAVYIDKGGKLIGWTSDLTETCKGRGIFLFEDNDRDGRTHVNTLARELSPHCPFIKIVRFREFKTKGFDVSNWAEQRTQELFGESFKDITNEQRAILRDELLARAEDWIDEEAPLDIEELLERAKSDPGALFESDMLNGLARLKVDEPAKYESLRAKLKALKVRIGELDKLVNKEVAKIVGESKDERTQAEIILDLAHEADLFHTADGVGFADVQIDEHRETWEIKSPGFTRWLTRRFYQETQKAPSSEAFKQAINVIEAEAQFDASERKIFVRNAGHNGKIYIDLCDSEWRAIEIDAEGWRINDKPPVRFRRANGMKELPVPRRNGSVERLKKYLNVSANEEFVLAVAFILMAMKDDGPFVILALLGEAGTAKSTVSTVIRGLIDPNVAVLRTVPREDRDLAIAAKNSHVQAFDNVSSLPPWMADALCRLATGSGFATRELYTNSDEVLFASRKPIILNGIEGFIVRPDLADRCLMLTLERITDENRKPENKLMEEFEFDAPGILGALLDAVSHGIRHLPTLELKALPRMADFFTWISACEGALWEKGTFAKAYDANRVEMARRNVEADPVALAIVENIERIPSHQWSGTTQGLLEMLNANPMNSSSSEARKHWPETPRALASRLTRIAPALRRIGVEISAEKDSHTHRAHISIVLKTRA